MARGLVAAASAGAPGESMTFAELLDKHWNDIGLVVGVVLILWWSRQ